MCSAGLAHRRLTPTNCDDLLFDDVLWVDNALRDHHDFVALMRDRGVEVVELHDMLTEILGQPDAKAWLLDRKIVANEVGRGLVDDTRSFLDGLPERTLAEYLIGGLATTDLPDDFRLGYVALARDLTGIRDYLMPSAQDAAACHRATRWSNDMRRRWLRSPGGDRTRSHCGGTTLSVGGLMCGTRSGCGAT